MLMVIKALAVLGIELVVSYLGGVLCNKCVLKRDTGLAEDTIIGFFLYQILCQIMTLGCYFTGNSVHVLAYAWIAVGVIVSVISMLVARKKIIPDIKCAKQQFQSCGKWGLGVLLVLLAFSYYVSINGETNADSQYYIGLINTTAATDTLYQYNVYNGYESNSFYIRRALATFECHSAILCQIFDIHALVLARVMRALQNVILTAGAVSLLGRMLFEKSEKRNAKICGLVILFYMLQPIYACNIYTNANFLLHRAYEGKAFTANVILLFVSYLTIRFIGSWKMRDLVAICLVWWGSIAISSSALILVPVLGILIIAPAFVIKLWRKQGRKKCKI